MTVPGSLFSVLVTSTTPTYSFSTTPASINEGSAGSFAITTTSVANGTTLYWTINNVSSGVTDFSTVSGSFTVTSNAGSFTVTPTADLLTEGSESFTVSIRTGSTTGTVVATSSSVTINDTSLTAVATDANYANVSLLLHGDGANSATNNTVIDSSTNAYTVTRSGAPTQGTFTPWSSISSSTTAYSTSTMGGSLSFNGANGDYLAVPATTGSTIGALAGKQTTIEFWMYCTGIRPVTAWNMGVFGNYQPVTSNGRFAISLSGSGATSNQNIGFGYTTSTGTGSSVTNTTALVQNTWNHIAITIDATTASSSAVKIYVNGVAQSFTANLSTHTADPGYGFHIGDDWSGNQTFNGYISNFRVVRSLVYTTTFTPSTAPLAAIANTSLLLSGTNGGIIDNAKKNDLVTVGDTKISTAQKKFGTGSIAFDGNGDYLTTTYSTANFDWWTTDYTLELWVYASSFTGWSYTESGMEKCVAIGNNAYNSTTNYWSFGPAANGLVRLYYFNGSANQITSTVACNVNQWNHIAFTKTSSGVRIWVNGVGNTATAISGTPQSSSGTPLTIGAGNAAYINGYVDDIRITKGVARYTANFSVPTAAFPDLAPTPTDAYFANVKFLAHYDTTTTDTTGHVESASYSASISSTQSKFGGASVYLAPTNVSGKRHVAYSSTDFVIGTQDFTLEGWIYPTTTGDVTCPISINGYYPNYNTINGRASTSGAVSLQNWGGNLEVVIDGQFTASGPAITSNQWSHIAVSRSGGTVYVSVNGVVVSATTAVANLDRSTLVIGDNMMGSASVNTNKFTGYVDDVRLTVGTARYTTDFAVPTTAFLNS